MRDHPPTLITANALNRSRALVVETLVPADSESSITRYQVLMRMMVSAIVRARNAVDRENMKTITPNKTF